MAALAVFAPSARASAWTDAAVQSARATVDVGPDGRAIVALELRVGVHGGWLEGLEVAGLDPDLELDPDKPAWGVAEDGTKLAPIARAREPGVVSLSFDRARAPRRGTHTVGIVFTTSLAHRATEPTADGRIRVRWTLPAWRSGLDDVAIDVLAPARAEAVALGEESIEHTKVEAGERVLLSWRRAHLPRTVAWTVELDVPEGAMDESLRRAASTLRRKQPMAIRPTGERWLAPLVAILLALLALAKVVAWSRACEEVRVRPAPLLPLSARARALAIAGAAAGGAYLLPIDPWASLALLAAVPIAALERTPREAAAPRLGGFRPATIHDRRAARRTSVRARLSLRALFDATEPLGLAALALFVAGSTLAFEHVRGIGWMTTPLHVALLIAPLFLTGTRRQLPLHPARRLRKAARVASRLRANGETPLAISLVVHADTDGVLQDARVRAVLAEAPRGLLRLDLAIADRPDDGGFASELTLVALARSGSPADEALARLAADLPDVVKDVRGGRTAHTFAVRGDASATLATAVRALTIAADEDQRSASRSASSLPRASALVSSASA